MDISKTIKRLLCKWLGHKWVICKDHVRRTGLNDIIALEVCQRCKEKHSIAKVLYTRKEGINRGKS